MKSFKKKWGAQSNVLTDHYVPARLPTYGQQLETFVPSSYSMNQETVITSSYRAAEAELDHIIRTCDKHSAGSECDAYIDAQLVHATALHESEVADHENQIIRIQAARTRRKAALEREILPLQARAEKLAAEIAPLEDLRAQFQLHVGRRAFSVGLPITIAAMAIDAVVNFSFLQNILLSNAALLAITVICMSIMSDLSMWAMGTYLSRQGESFTSKPLFWAVTASLAGMFLLSTVTSILVRFGSMEVTFGSINATGEFVGKDAYTMAETGITLITAFLTTATGLLSFAFSLDKNAFLISLRERKRSELRDFVKKLEALHNELALLENAPDPWTLDLQKRAAAERQLEALRTGLKLHCRKMMVTLLSDPNFTEKMEISAEELIHATAGSVSHHPAASTLDRTKVS